MVSRQSITSQSPRSSGPVTDLRHLWITMGDSSSHWSHMTGQRSRRSPLEVREVTEVREIAEAGWGEGWKPPQTKSDQRSRWKLSSKRTSALSLLVPNTLMQDVKFRNHIWKKQGCQSLKLFGALGSFLVRPMVADLRVHHDHGKSTVPQPAGIEFSQSQTWRPQGYNNSWANTTPITADSPMRHRHVERLNHLYASNPRPLAWQHDPHPKPLLACFGPLPFSQCSGSSWASDRNSKSSAEKYMPSIQRTWPSPFLNTQNMGQIWPKLIQEFR